MSQIPPEVVSEVDAGAAERKLKVGIIISGGAPTVHLAAGALCAFSERGITFELIATAGAGALPGLLFAAPKKRYAGDERRNREDALKSVVNLNIHDAIYQLLPNNYKVFHKYGPFSQFFWRLGRKLPRYDLPPAGRYGNAFERLYNDCVDLVVTAFTPPTLRYQSKSVLTRVEVISDLVDWQALKDFAGEFYLNGFSLEDRRLKAFDKNEMSPEAFYAALAMPWLYPPTAFSGRAFTEGASHDPSGLEAAMRNASPEMRRLDAVIIVDTIGPDVWVDPESSLESLALTIMDPMVALTENVAALYALEEHVFNAIQDATMPKIYRLPFKIPDWDRSKLWDWSYTNALSLWDAGRASALEFCDGLGSNKGPAEEYRHIRTLLPNPRMADLLALFGFKPHGTPPSGARVLFQ